MSKDNPYSLIVNVEDAICVVEFDITHGEINYETWEVFYNKDFKGKPLMGWLPNEWTKVTDLLHDKTWLSIEDQIKEQWADVEAQQRAYYEDY